MSKKSLIVALVILSGLFYWFQIRPAKIRSYCSWFVRWEDKGPKCARYPTSAPDCYDLHYKACLHDKGL